MLLCQVKKEKLCDVGGPEQPAAGWSFEVPAEGDGQQEARERCVGAGQAVWEQGMGCMVADIAEPAGDVGALPVGN